MSVPIDMEQRRYHTDPATGEFILLEWTSQYGWFPAMPTLEDWQCGAARIYRPTDLPDSLVTMPNHLYWQRLAQSEEDDIIVLLARPWIQNSYAQDVARDDQIDILDAATVSIPDLSEQSSPVAYPPHIIDAVLDHAETTEKICPITMEPIQKATATLTRCGHIFQKAALTEWLKTRSSCPECRLTLSQ